MGNREKALYWNLVLARLEALAREMEAMRPAVDAYLYKNLVVEN